MSVLDTVWLLTEAQVVEHDFSGEVLVPQPNDPALAFLTAIVEHGGDASTRELATHLLGHGRVPIATQILEAARRQNLVELTYDSRWIVSDRGTEALRSAIIRRREFGVWRVRFLDVAGFSPLPLDLVAVPAQNLGELHARQDWRPPQGTEPSQALLGLLATPFEQIRGKGAPHIIETIAGSADPRAYSVQVPWYPVTGDIDVTLDGDSQRIPFHQVSVDVVAGQLAGEMNGTFDPDVAGFRVGQEHLGEESILHANLDLEEIDAEIELRGSLMRYLGFVPVRPVDAHDGQRWLVRRILHRLDRYVTADSWPSLLEDNRHGLGIEDADLDEVTPELVQGCLEDEPTSDLKILQQRFLQAPQDWYLSTPDIPETRDADQMSTRQVFIAGEDEQLADALMGIIDRSRSMLVISSFIIAFDDLEDRLAAAAERGVRVYLLTASGRRLQQRPRDYKDRERLAKHDQLLQKLTSTALLRSAPGFHSKVVLRDPADDPEGILSTANLVHSEVSYNDDVAVALTPDELYQLFLYLRWSFWERAEHELRPGTLEAILPLDLVEHPEPRLPALATTGLVDTFSDKFCELIAQHEDITLSTFEASPQHPVVRSLAAAAASGKRVTVLTRASPRTRASLPALKQLHSAGARVLGTRQMHAKLAMFDDSTAVIGSGNLRDHDDPSRLELGLLLEDERCQHIGRILDQWTGTAGWQLHGTDGTSWTPIADGSTTPM